MSQKINAAMIAVMKKVEAIGKDQRNQQQGFQFRGIDQCYNELHNLLAEEGIITLPIVEDSKTEERAKPDGRALRFTVTTVTYRFMADDGSYVDCKMIGEGMDSGDKSASKSVAIAHKYALLQTFLIPTQEQKDPDYETHEVRSRTTKDPNAELQMEGSKTRQSW